MTLLTKLTKLTNLTKLTTKNPNPFGFKKCRTNLKFKRTR